MGKLETTRILLQSPTSIGYILCKFAHGKSRGQPYVKIIFPSFSSASCSFTENIGFRESDGSLYTLPNSRRASCDPIEVSYHYMEGVKHINTRERDHLSQSRSFPILPKTSEPVLLCRASILNFQSCHRTDDSLLEDIVLDNVSLPCVFGFYFGYKNGAGELPYIDRSDGRAHHLSADSDENLAITITEYKAPNLNSNFIHMNNDPYAHNQ